jgi:hypothetical protein
MTGSTLHLATLMPLTLVAGLLMAKAGTQKKMLSWKRAPGRCPACGQVGRHDCPCRR